MLPKAKISPENLLTQRQISVISACTEEIADKFNEQVRWQVYDIVNFEVRYQILFQLLETVYREKR